MRRVAKMRINREIIEELLDFPPGVEIVGAAIRDNDRTTLELVLYGEGLPADCETPEGQPIPLVLGVVNRVYFERVKES